MPHSTHAAQTSADRLRALIERQGQPVVMNRGIERETLRTDGSARLSLTPHPASLGNKLTHPSITTDFSESQLELITPVFQSVDALLNDLTTTHQFVARQLGKERLWPGSMPCILPDEQAIPLADYGLSSLGRLKKAYRNGLGLRYNRIMQTICAVHYNFSMSDADWDGLRSIESREEERPKFVARRYFDLMRNFRRWSWLPLYLFGASPAVDRSFLTTKQQSLFSQLDADTFYLPFATSLRSGDLGYQSHIQSDHIYTCYNSLADYAESLRQAITTPHADYEHLAERHGAAAQISPHILQSEAEFYTTVRAKTAAPPGENFLKHLLRQGPTYIEIRLLDVNPFTDIGVTAEQIHFLDLFLLHCLLSDSPRHDPALCDEVQSNFRQTVTEGRRHDIPLLNRGTHVSLGDWGKQLLDALSPLAERLDHSAQSSRYSEALATMTERVNNPDQTPSGQILAMLTGESISLRQLMQRQSERFHEALVKQPWPGDLNEAFTQSVAQSHDAAKTYPDSDDHHFLEYLNEFVAAYRLAP